MATPDRTSSAAEEFYDGALARIRKFLLAASTAGVIASLIFFHWQTTAGFVAGAVISYVNHSWLERMVTALGERITTGQSRERGGGIVFRAVLRYAFIAIGAYVIFNVSLAGLYGFLAGICLPIVAISCEVAVEIFTALRRRF